MRVWNLNLFKLLNYFRPVFCSVLLRFIEIKTILMSGKYSYLLNLTDRSRDRLMFWNKLSIAVALVVSGSTSLLASVRISELYYIHIYASLVCFTSGPVLYLIHTYITLRLTPIVTSVRLAYIRLGLTLMMIIAGIVFGYTQFTPDGNPVYELIGQQLTADPDRVHHILQAASEYVFVLLISPYFLTYIPEVRRLKCIQSAQFEYIFK